MSSGIRCWCICSTVWRMLSRGVRCNATDDPVKPSMQSQTHCCNIPRVGCYCSLHTSGGLLTTVLIQRFGIITKPNAVPLDPEFSVFTLLYKGEERYIKLQPAFTRAS